MTQCSIGCKLCPIEVFVKQFCMVFLFLAAIICSLAAQDLIVLKNGNMIEAKVLEISPTEIRYKDSSNLNGPTIVIPANSVLSIRYENGTSQVINTKAGTEPLMPMEAARYYC